MRKLKCLAAGVLATLAAASAGFAQEATDGVADNPFYQKVQQASVVDVGSTSLAGAPEESGVQTVSYEDPDVPLEQRFEALAEEWQSYKKGVDKKKADSAKKPSYKIGGRLHADYWAFPNATEGINYFENPSGPLMGTDPEDRLLFRRLRVETKGDIFDTMLYDFDFDFATPGRVEIKDAYLGFKNLPNNQSFLIGNQKRPLGLDHLNSSRFNVFIERPMVVDSFNDDARRLGMAMYGYSDDELYHWRYGVYNLDNVKSTGKYIGDHMQLSGNARLSSSPWYDESSGGRGYFHWAVAGMVAHPDGLSSDTASNDNEGRFRARPEARSTRQWVDTRPIAGIRWYEILGFETILNVGALQVVAEWQSNWVQRDETTSNPGDNLNFHGGYIYAAYTLTGEHVPYNRKTGTIGRMKPFENFFLVDRCDGGYGHGWGLWQVAFRYSYLDITDRDIQGGVGTNYTFGLNWWWTSHSRLQFNAIVGDIDERRAAGGFSSGNYTILGTRFAVDF